MKRPAQVIGRKPGRSRVIPLLGVAVVASLGLGGCAQTGGPSVGQIVDEILTGRRSDPPPAPQDGGVQSTQGMEPAAPAMGGDAGAQPQPPAAIVIRQFVASPNAVVSGDAARLYWSVTNATRVRIEPNLGFFGPQGNVAVKPAQTTSYTLVAEGPGGGWAQSAITVTVNPKGATAAPKGAVVVVAPPGNACRQSFQGAIQKELLDRLCRGAENSPQPVACYREVMSGRVNHGGGTQWAAGNAVDLCEGTTNAAQTIGCFRDSIRARLVWQKAIQRCQRR